ncbi:MAG: ABC transporter permease [Acidimicrobiia bacterium]
MTNARSPALYAGITIIGFFVLIAVGAGYVSPHSPYEMGIPYLKPSGEHFLGTNDVGQDILSELIHGTRVSLFIGFAAAFVVTGVGTVLALIAGYFGGLADVAITAVTNVAMALPSLPLTVLLIAYLSGGKWSLILAMSITAWTGTSRILRTRVQQVCQMPFILAERGLGVRSPVIIFKHILPNITDIILMRGSLSIASAMLTETGLSFLGLGTYGEKSWGNILHYAFFRNSIVRGAYWWYVPPIVCISVAVLGFMLVGYYGRRTL